MINGFSFVWHQLKELLDYYVNVNEKVEDLNETEIKPLSISKSKLSEAKALIKWVVGNYSQSQLVQQSV